MLDGALLKRLDHVGGRSNLSRMCWNVSLLMNFPLAAADARCRWDGEGIDMRTWAMVAFGTLGATVQGVMRLGFGLGSGVRT
jgi:hypothetical protein